MKKSTTIILLVSVIISSFFIFNGNKSESKFEISSEIPEITTKRCDVEAPTGLSLEEAKGLYSRLCNNHNIMSCVVIGEVGDSSYWHCWGYLEGYNPLDGDGIET